MINFSKNYTNKSNKITSNNSLDLSKFEVKSFFQYTIFDKKKAKREFYSE